MTDFIAAYRDYLTEEKHASANTVSAYLRDIHQLWEYLREHGIDLRHADSMALQGYVGYMLSRGKSAASVTRFLASSKSFYNFLLSQGDVKTNPARGVTAAKAADELLTLKGIRASFVLYKKGDGVYMSARSLGEVNVQVILEALGGGGNSTTAGGQADNITVAEAKAKLLEAIDKYFEN